MNCQSLLNIMKARIVVLILIVILLPILSKKLNGQANNLTPQNRFFEVQSIDTMKYSRDTAGEMLTKPSFDDVIDQQVKNIAGTGATHVAIGTPYDNQFIPFLARWVKVARRYKLKVWFRGNLSGWEGWFGYEKINREQHKQGIRAFITKNSNLFEDGDIFSSCPECENGGPGDPRQTGDIDGHRKFLIAEYELTKEAFKEIGKNVRSNYFSMNGDVAQLIMDPQTTAALDGIVVIDHYVSSPTQMVDDIKTIADKSGGKVVLGEFGAPIPDIHGNMNQDEQAQWIQDALSQLTYTKQLTGLNYWTSVGGSAEIWDSQGRERKAVSVIRDYFSPKVIQGTITNRLGRPLKNALVSDNQSSVSVDSKGRFIITYVGDKNKIKVTAPNYLSKELNVNQSKWNLHISLEPEEKGFFSFLRMLFSR